MCALLGDSEALELWGPPLDRAGAEDWIRRNRERYVRDGFGRCAVSWRDAGELVGDCGLIVTDVEGAREVELDWIVRDDMWGRGVATEARAAWRDFAFAATGVDRLVSMISGANRASRRVGEKLGFTVEREAMWGGHRMLMDSLGPRP